MVPSGMNDRNLEDMGKYIDVGHCAYLVDSVFEDGRAGADAGVSLTQEEMEVGVEKEEALEPRYIDDMDRWEVAKCVPFLDVARTGIVGRLIWVPDSDWVPQRFRRVWGRHCLLKARKG